jgi:hypothetical protein
VTEYAESRPHVSSVRIAADLRRAVELAARVPEVRMFVWFMLQNHRHEPWQSGLVGTGAFASFRTAASALDPRNGRVVWPRDRGPLVVRVSARELRLRGQSLQNVSVTYTVSGCESELSRTGDVARMQRNGFVPVLVEPGEVEPTKLVITLRNTAGRQVAREFAVVGGAASTCA